MTADVHDMLARYDTEIEADAEYLCAYDRCGDLIEGDPVIDVDEVGWWPKAARRYCSISCMECAIEQQAS